MSYDKADELMCVGVAVGVIGVIAAIVLAFCLKRTDYVLDVKRVQWVSTVYEQKYQKIHYNRQTAVRSNAYNIKSYTETDSHTWTDSDGKKHVSYDSTTYYDYDVNEWRTIAQHVDSGTNKEIKYKEVEVPPSHTPPALGDRCTYNGVEFYAYGVYHNSQEEPEVRLEIPQNIWSDLKVGDRLTYSKRNVGKPFDIEIAQ